MKRDQYMLVIECNDGIHTNAIFYRNGKGIASAGAKKHPDDDFDFWTAVETVTPRVKAYAKLLAPPDPLEVWNKLKANGRFAKLGKTWYAIAGDCLVAQTGAVYGYFDEDIRAHLEEIAEAKNFKSLSCGNYRALYKRKR